MGQQAITLATNVTVNNSAITSNGVFDVWTSSILTNNNALPCLRLVTEYANITPNDSQTGIGSTFGLSIVVEAQIGTRWFPIAYQFGDYRSPGNGETRIIILQPDMSTFDSGIDDNMFVGGQVIARISRQQGKVGATYRVKLVCQENGHGGAGSFQSVNINIYGELFD